MSFFPLGIVHIYAQGKTRHFWKQKKVPFMSLILKIFQTRSCILEKIFLWEHLNKYKKTNSNVYQLTYSSSFHPNKMHLIA
jgi:hypothetical protein